MHAATAGAALDLLLVAALELSATDAEVRSLVADAAEVLTRRLPDVGTAELLGRRLLLRGGLPASPPVT